MYTLGISAFYHDSAACLVYEGEIIAAAQEERFTRKKHDPGFPHRAVQFCLAQAGIGITDIKYIVFYDKPLIKFERLLETYVGFSPRGIQSFLAAMPVWLKEKLLLRNLLQKEVLACAEGVDKAQLPEICSATTMSLTLPPHSLPRLIRKPVCSAWTELGNGRRRLLGLVKGTH